MVTVVLGLGISGKAAVSFLLSQKKQVIGIDRNVAVMQPSQHLHIVQEGADLCWSAIDQCIVSPGIPPHHPDLLRMKKENIPIVGEVEFACQFLDNTIIGVTGSNGKTTTTLLIAHVLQFHGLSAKAVGNVGVGLSSYLLEKHPKDILVLELSSFQLETFHAQCLHSAVLLNISPNHLDRHASMEEYVQTKLSIAQRVKPQGLFLLSQQVQEQYGCAGTCFSSYLPQEKEQNLQAAFAICQQFQISKEMFYEAYQTFQKPSHRLEKVGIWDGVIYYNDSKSSNVDSVLYAIARVQEPIVLIVGGVDKGASYAPWKEPLAKKVKWVVAYGAAREKIAKEIGERVPLKTVELFADAVDDAMQQSSKGDAILLSPGCSSYDQFKNFEHRGDVFKELIRRRYGEKENSSNRSIH